MRRRKAAAALICVGCLFLAAAVALGGYNLWDDYRAARAASGVLDRLSGSRPSDGSTPDYVLNPDMEMPTQEIDGYLYIGRLTVPALGLELPVLDGWSYPNLRLAPCRYAGTAYRPGFVLCAHNYASHFGRLKNLAPGDEVEFTDLAGNRFFYEVAEIENLAPTAVEEMKQDNWDLTLFSCTLSGRTRVTVRCRRAETPEN